VIKQTTKIIDLNDVIRFFKGASSLFTIVKKGGHDTQPPSVPWPPEEKRLTARSIGSIKLKLEIFFRSSVAE